jgi:hypothetical protein
MFEVIIYIINMNPYYESSYTARTVNGIKELYETLNFACNICKTRRTDSKMEVQDTYHPTFVITRKKICMECWLKMVSKSNG